MSIYKDKQSGRIFTEQEMLDAVDSGDQLDSFIKINHNNPYLDMNYQDRTDQIQSLFDKTVDDMKRDPELYAEVFNDLLFHWIYGTRETVLMNMFKQDIVKPTKS